MNVPRVSAIGVVEYPAEFSASPRRIGGPLRVIAGVMLVVFTLVVVATTVYSLGHYCLTSQASYPSVIPDAEN